MEQKPRDRSSLISSIIVSLLAGFIYYQFGNDIQDKIDKSMKAVFSSASIEAFGPEQNKSFVSVLKKSEFKNKKNKSKFYFKNKHEENFASEKSIDPQQLLTEYILSEQSKASKPAPDRNIDFSAELNKLIKKNIKDKNKSEFNFKINRDKYERRIEVSDNESSESHLNSLNPYSNRNLNKIYINTGNGFEYNTSISKEDENANENCQTEVRENDCNKLKSYQYKINDNKLKIEYKTEMRKEIKVNIVVPKIQINVNGEELKIEIPEIFIEDELLNQ